MEVKICHIYPDVLNLYGDSGNITCFVNRLRWRGISVSVTQLPIGETDSLTDYDLFFLGGGQDFEQEVLLNDLHSGRDRNLVSAIEDGKTFLAICGGYQMLGSYYQNAQGNRCDFLGAIDFHTESAHQRMIGNYAFRCGDSSGCSMVVGFENHNGKTYLGNGITPLGTVVKGCGNNGEDGTEGVRYKNVFGTYSHGPVLPKNPLFCDHILQTLLERKYGSCVLSPLDDQMELQAHAAALRLLGL